MAKRTGLGRGIGALIPTADQSERPVDVFFPGASTKAAAAAAAAAELASAQNVEDVELTTVPGIHLVQINPNDIVPNPRQPRTHFDPSDLAELVHSVREFGVLQPVIVRKNADGQHELIMGERRTRAAREAGLETISAIVRETADEDLLRDALLENLHRSELNPLEEASAYQQLLEDFGITQEELATRIGRSRPQISNTIRLLRLPVPVQQRVAAGVLSAGHARALLSLDDAAAMQKLADKVVNEDLSVRATEEAAKAVPSAGTKKTKPQPGARRAYLDEVSGKLGDRLNTRVKITLGARKGQVAIEFASIQDLNRILSELGEEGYGS
ncbi:MAG TPA: chromosome partitioning protein ParB [Microbacterium sp.]|uniref:ParB/RepB/Spo0J family partition protein n=1 Tax=Microbacterium sp. TaxID=51671 RepID=UPI000EC017B5|nr:chromosome partitioning protein ParB [Microbacterium sp.]